MHDASIRFAMSIVVGMCDYSATYRIRPFYIDRTGLWHEEHDAWRVLQTGKPLNNIEILNYPGTQQPPCSASVVDVWLPALHGPYDKDSAVQGLLTLIDAPFVCVGTLGCAVDTDIIDSVDTIPSLAASSTCSKLWKASGFTFSGLLHQLLKSAIESDKAE